MTQICKGVENIAINCIAQATSFSQPSLSGQPQLKLMHPTHSNFVQLTRLQPAFPP